MEISGNENHFVFTKRIEFSFDGQSEFVEMREFNMQELKDYQRATLGKTEEEQTLALLDKLDVFFPACLVDSSFTFKGEKASAKQVYEVLKKNSELFTQILTCWMKKAEDKKNYNVNSDGESVFA